ncbi:MAG TPA: translation initiation factor IF-2 N-terminal domain-containing protein, partial [bacterium]|nr:translation initiation factor IF-2 N-terminal domain-containing protein [bacterium]
MKVHELARELGLTSKELIDRLEAMKVSVRNHMSVLDADTVARLRRGAAAPAASPAGTPPPSPEPARGPGRAVADDKVRQ